MKKQLIHFALTCFLLSPAVVAQEADPYDPFTYSGRSAFESDADQDVDEFKTVDELLREAMLLQQGEHLLDSRTKLLKALEKDPKDFRVHVALADYYTRHVGHFRLALKYTKQAQNLFTEKYGPPPYPATSLSNAYHSDMLLLLSQARLNLDDYSGALDALFEFERLGYESPSLPASKAWILMKLGKLEEAIQISRAGLMAGANPGHTLNILGILLSMTGERQASLDIFKEALRYELSLGAYGNPSTPLNNSGEVYKEIFDEENAKRSWLRAVQLPDGCEHVLPSLNLALLYIDEMNLKQSKQSIDNFEACFAQFPLRNGEEHKALVELARGRIALHSGQIDEALVHLSAAQQRQQWFGKIGTNPEDLQVAIQSSLAYALRVKNAHLRSRYYESVLDWGVALKERTANAVRAWWLLRDTRRTLTNDLEAVEDLYIRHTDSMIEYPTFGSVLATYPLPALAARVADFQSSDNRQVAASFYAAYLAEAEIEQGAVDAGLDRIEQTLQGLRSPQDGLLRGHLLTLKLGVLQDPKEFRYIKTAYEVLAIHPALIRNAGEQLAVNFVDIPDEIRDAFHGTSLLLTNEQRLPVQVQYEETNGYHTLKLFSESPALGAITVKAPELEEAINKFVNTVFSRAIS